MLEHLSLDMGVLSSTVHISIHFPSSELPAAHSFIFARVFNVQISAGILAS